MSLANRAATVRSLVLLVLAAALFLAGLRVAMAFNAATPHHSVSPVFSGGSAPAISSPAPAVEQEQAPPPAAPIAQSQGARAKPAPPPPQQSDGCLLSGPSTTKPSVRGGCPAQ